MRWSVAFIPTLRDDPADAEAVSHRLLVRGGYIRQLMAGVYSMLPLGQRVRAKVMAIIKEEIDAIGGQEFLLPQLHPISIWEQTGRIDTMRDIIMSFEDNKGGTVILGPTHEEIFATAATELTSYKQLPQLWYHIQTKFRDEARPKSGLLRVREFTMKDSYTFDADFEGLNRQFDRHYDAYVRIFERLGMEVVSVEASSGAMGGKESVEFMVRSDVGEDEVAACPEGDYAANLETATSTLPSVADPDGPLDVQRFATPGVRTIADLVSFDGGASTDRQIKTLVYVLDDVPTLVLLRGDHALQEQKLADATRSVDVRSAQADEIKELLGADAGSLGAVGVEGIPILADAQLAGRAGLTTGANENDFHVRGVDIERDISVTEWLDLRTVNAGEACPNCGEPLDVYSAIEVGHIFKLGTFYAEKLGLSVLDENGATIPIVMGSYGIGVERNMAASIEANHDDKGIVWPLEIAPYHVVITVVRPDDERSSDVSTTMYDELRSAGVEVLLDDRMERPGVKFTDAELIGIPLRITVGPRGLESGVVEFALRRSGEQREVATEDAIAEVHAFLKAAR
ncbi:MAG: proline--tRNA ligase [Acidimicrobiia bacterium]|nr:MAG: proline--tRNA ligase [Acidimicrobiia bacterium]